MGQSDSVREHYRQSLYRASWLNEYCRIGLKYTAMTSDYMAWRDGDMFTQFETICSWPRISG